MSILFSVIAPVFVIIGFGYIAVWRNWTDESTMGAVMKVTQTLVIPCLLFHAIATLDLSTSFDLKLLLMYYSGALFGFITGLLGARFIFSRPWDDAVVIGFVGMFSNTLLLGVPITERAYGPDALSGNYSIIAIHAPLCYLVGITTMELVRAQTRNPIILSRKVLNAMFHNTLIIGVACGFIVNLSGITPPVFFMEAVALFARAALPMALFALGGVLVGYKTEGDMRVIIFICFVALIVPPSIAWVAGLALGIPTAGFRSAIITAAMAPGINGYIFANMYGVAKRVSASAVLLGTIATFFTTWGWLWLLR